MSKVVLFIMITNAGNPSDHHHTSHAARLPITPNRYRAPSSLGQAFPSTPTSRRSSLVEGGDDSPPSKSSTSNWQASIELSLTTRRRLIRKPLPQIPSSQPNGSSTADDVGNELLDAASLDARYQQADSWWPDALPERQPYPAPSSSIPSDIRQQSPSSSSHFRTESSSAHQHPRKDGDGLDEQSLRHLITILHYAALRYESVPASSHDDGTIGRNVVVSATGTYKKQTGCNTAAPSASDSDTPNNLYIVDEATLDSLYRALQAAFRHLSQKQVLGALQRTASIRWRAEAQLRNASAAQAAEASNGLSSRWARFAWPAAALGRAYKEAQRNILPPNAGDIPTSGLNSASRLQWQHELYAGTYPTSENRIRKRDVAVKILSNAIWFVRNYGPVAGVETLQEAGTEVGEGATLEETNISSLTTGDGLPPPALSSIRRTSENLLKKNAGLPHFLSKSSATTALSGTATPESSQSNVPAPVETSSSPTLAAAASAAAVRDPTAGPSSVSGPQSPSASSETRLNPLAATVSSMSPEAGEGSASETDIAPVVASSTNSAAGEKSKALEHLASLSAAAGAALRQRAQQAATAAAASGGRSEETIDTVSAASGTLHPQSSRPSLRSFVSRSEAEAAETDALERAERDYLAKVGQGCDEWAKMVVCRLCASIQVASASDRGHRRRSGTLTARDFGKAATAHDDGSVGSSLSTRSDMTAKAGRVGQRDAQRRDGANADIAIEDQSEDTVSWKPDVFDGQELFAHSASSSHERGAGVSTHDVDERVRLVGGSFLCRVQSEEEKRALTDLLELALYVGMSMLLESHLLSDSEAARPKLIKVPSRTTSAADAIDRGASLIQQPSLSRATSRQNLDGGQRSASGSTLQASHHAGLGADVDEETHEAESAHSKPGSRKWTKSLWGMLGQHPHGSADAEAKASSGRPGTSDGHEVGAPRKSLTMHRYHTEDDTSSLSSNLARKTLFKAGEEPKQSIAARKAALFANVSNNSAPASPQGSRGATGDQWGPSSSKPHRLVGRLMNAFVRPSSTETSCSDASALNPSTAFVSHTPPVPGKVVEEVSSATSQSRDLSYSQRQRIQTKSQPSFPLKVPSPPALSTSPELSMLLCYQYQMDSAQATFPTTAYMTAFHRLQALRFLTDQHGEHSTFASPSHGISASGDLLPFVGVHKQTSSPWSVMSSRAQQQQQVSERLSTRTMQLLSYELLSGDGSALGLCREEVAFYQRLSNSRDVPLGQVIEELGIRACALEADREAASKTTDSRLGSGKAAGIGGKDRNDATAGNGLNGAYGMPEQRLQFIHGSCRIKVVATVLPSRLCDSESDAERGSGIEAEKASIESGFEAGSARASPSLRPTRSRDSDISAIAAALHTDKEAANTAFAVAETAVQAAETGTSQPLVDQRGSASTSGIWMWNASAKSGWQAKAMPMSESTYLLSFARYLEAISYHPALRRAAGLEPANAKAYGGLANVQQQLRQGRSEDARSVAEGPNLLRFFRNGRALVKVQVQPLILYDLHIEGPCLKAGSERRRDRKQKQAQVEKRRFKQLVEETRLEIQHFFASIKSNTTKLEDIFVSRDLDEAGKTIRKRSAAQQVGTSPAEAENDAFTTSSASSTVSDQVAEPLDRLTNLRSSLRSDEFELYEALQRTIFLDGINDVRKAFADRAKSAKNRLGAWIKKHLTKKEQAELGNCTYIEPEYLEVGRRAFPGSCYIIRDDEPLSIIAFSLSSRDFRAEMGTLPDRRHESGGYMGSSNDEHVKQWRSRVVDDGDTATVGSHISSSATSTATAASSLLKDRSMRKVPFSQLDPDEDEVFFDAEPVHAALKRKKRGRESSILSLTLRRVGSTISESQGVKYRTLSASGRPTSSAGSFKDPDDDDEQDDDEGDEDETDTRSSIIQSSIDGQDTTLDAGRIGTTPSRKPSAAALMDQTTPSKGKPELRTMGSVSALRRTFELRSQSSFSSIPDRKSSMQQRPQQSADTSTVGSTASTNTTFHAQITPVSGRPASLASIFSSDKPFSKATDARISSTPRRSDAQGLESAAPRTIPRSTSTGRHAYPAEETPSNGTSPSEHDNGNAHKHAAQPSSTTEGVAGADAHSMVSNSTLPGSQAAESPHIKHNLVHGSTKISCVSWFAEEFAALRERWGVEHDFAHSLSRCQPWVATGGKSKSAFFKTADERFIAKQLLTVWSVDEKEAFLEFAPAYIRYMMNSAVNNCPTLLVKIAGVYSIKIKNIKSGETKLKMNVMLLENLWAGDGGKSIRFDLKGIRDRRVKLSAQQQQTLQQATTNASAGGQALVDVPGPAQGSTTPSSATADWNAGVQSKASSESSCKASEVEAGNGSTQVSPSRAGETNKKANESSAAGGGGGETKSSSGSSAVWWDSEWIERYRHRAFVPEPQKELFFRALQNDTSFLTASNVMDYSLLLGVMERPVRPSDMYPPAAPSAGVNLGGQRADLEANATTTTTTAAGVAGDTDRPSERPSFRCRIVDFLGAFTLAKQLESSSKKALKGHEAKGNVTILPPCEYASRFLAAMDSYFIGTPCQPRLDPMYGFDKMCHDHAAHAEAENEGESWAVRRPRLPSVL